MKKMTWLLLVVCLPALTPGLAQADDTNQPPSQNAAPKLRSMTPEQRQEFLQSHPRLAKRLHARRQMLARLGLTPQDLKCLAPADRRAKIKAAAETRVAALQQKQAGGALTPEEQSDLTFLQRRLERASHRTAAPAPNAGKLQDN